MSAAPAAFTPALRAALAPGRAAATRRTGYGRRASSASRAAASGSAASATRTSSKRAGEVWRSSRSSTRAKVA
jgi:hypothetical protein